MGGWGSIFPMSRSPCGEAVPLSKNIALKVTVAAISSKAPKNQRVRSERVWVGIDRVH